MVVGGYLAEELRFGNAHFFCIWLMVLAWDRVESGRVLVPAAALAVAIATKLTPLALLAYFRRCAADGQCVWRRCHSRSPRRPACRPDGMGGGNMRQLRAFETYALEKVDEGDNYSLRGVLFRYLTPGHADVSHVEANVADMSPAAVNALWAAGLLALGLSALAAFWKDDDDGIARILEVSIVLTGIVLAAEPHTQRRKYFVTLFVPVVALLTLRRRARSDIERRLLLTGVLATALPATILPLIFGGRRLALIYEAGSSASSGPSACSVVLVVLTLEAEGPELIHAGPECARRRDERLSVDSAALLLYDKGLR